jgi:hypothetical protein
MDELFEVAGTLLGGALGIFLCIGIFYRLWQFISLPARAAKGAYNFTREARGEHVPRCPACGSARSMKIRGVAHCEEHGAPLR